MKLDVKVHNTAQTMFFNSLHRHACSEKRESYIKYYHKEDVGSKSVHNLSHFYTNVPPVNESIKKSSVSATIHISLKRNDYKQQTEQEYFWLKYARKVLDSKAESFNNVS